MIYFWCCYQLLIDQETNAFLVAADIAVLNVGLFDVQETEGYRKADELDRSFLRFPHCCCHQLLANFPGKAQVTVHKPTEEGPTCSDPLRVILFFLKSDDTVHCWSSNSTSVPLAFGMHHRCLAFWCSLPNLFGPHWGCTVKKTFVHSLNTAQDNPN